ncbi:MAG: tetratricopeptide repeat protein [Candidatus Obscuribacterales bacterium]|nr:tetratricopeptide repeat protein [Candidatus Obscuribacterales bacterium]
MHLTKKLRSAIVLCLWLSQPYVVFAQSPPQSVATQAEQQGRQAMEGGQYDRAEQFFSQAVDALKATGVINARLIGDLLSHANACEQAGNDKAALVACQQALALLKQVQSPAPDLVARAHSTCANINQALGDLDGAISQNNEALNVLQQQYGASSSNLADPIMSIAGCLTAQDKLTDAEQKVKQALTFLGNNHPHQAARANMLLGEIYNQQGKFDEAEPPLKRALGLYEGEQNLDYGGLALAMGRLARTYMETSRLDSAESMLNKAISTDKKTQNPSVAQHRQVVWFLIELADLYNRENKHEQAETQLTIAQDLSKLSFSADHYINAIILNRLASTYLQEGKYAEAEQIYKQILSYSQANSASGKQPKSGPFQLGLAATAKVDASSPDSKDTSVLTEALERSKKSLGQVHPEVGNALANLGWVCLMEKKYGDAQSYFQQALDIRKAAFGLNHRQTASSLQSLAVLDVKEKKYDQAEQLYQQSLGIYRKLEGDQNAQVIMTLISLSNLHAQMAQLAKAEQDLRDALTMCNTMKVQKQKVDPNAVLDDAASQLSANEAFGGGDDVVALTATALSLNPDQLTGPETPIAATVLMNLSTVLLKESKLKEAESLARQALKIRQHCYGADRPLTAQAMVSLSGVLAAEKQLAEADSLLQQAVTILKTGFGDHSKQYAAAITKLAQVEVLEGKSEDAKKLESQASEINDSLPNTSDSATQ